MKRALLTVVLTSVLAAAAIAQGYDIKTMTPEVQAALEARKGRFAELKALKGQGFAGENNRGYVEAMGGGAEAKALVKAENADRKAVYQAIVEQNELGEAALATVEAVFAGVQREKAAAGEKVQDPSGEWITR
jgi:uncharacterized protein YdbL (DUF1318 family)